MPPRSSIADGSGTVVTLMLSRIPVPRSKLPVTYANVAVSESRFDPPLGLNVVGPVKLMTDVPPVTPSAPQFNRSIFSTRARCTDPRWLRCVPFEIAELRPYKASSAPLMRVHRC